MPNWKKVIVSGSDASLNSLYVNNGITGSLEGTASFAVTASYAFNAITSSYLSGSAQLYPISDPDPLGSNLTNTYLFQSASNTSLGNDLYIRQNGNLIKWKWIEGLTETGLLYGGLVSWSGSEIYVSSGSGIIVNYNASYGEEISPIIDYVQWGEITASVTNITSSQVTYIYIDDNGDLNQQTTPFTPQQYNETIPLGAVGHFDYTNISAFGSLINTAYGQQGQVNSFMEAFGPLKMNGYTLVGQSGSLTLNVGSGTSFIHGGFYPQDPELPSIFTSPSQITASIVRCYTSGSETIFDTNGGSFYTTIDPTQYDNAGTLSSVSNNDWTIQRVFSYPPNNTLYIYYGQSVYADFASALDGVASDPFIEGLATQPFTTFVGYLVVKSNGTSLTDSDSRIIQAGLFRNIVGGSTGGGATVTNLEDLADVTVTSPVTGEALIYNAGVWINGYPTTSSFSTTSSFAITASYAFEATSASYAFNSTSSSYALTASYIDGPIEGAKTFEQGVANVTWSFVHNFGTYTPIVQVYDSSYNQLLPAGVVGISDDTTEIYFAYPETGFAIISTGGNLLITGSNAKLVQTAAAATWSFEHGLGEQFPVFTIFDDNNDVIIPTRIAADNAYTASIYFSSARTGTAVAANCGLSGSTFDTAISSSYALTASFALDFNPAATASYALEALTSSFALEALTASYALEALTSSFAQTASYVDPLNQIVVLTQVSESLNFADDAAAALGGVPLGGLYRNGNFILIRLV